MPDVPAYLRIAGELRELIASGALAPGDRVPSQNELANQYGVSPSAAFDALEVLENEGLVEPRRGSGTFVRSRPTPIVRHGYQRQQRAAAGSTSPFQRDVEAAGMVASWDYETERSTATPDIARRLHIQPGDPVMVTHLVFRADGDPVQLGTSWEPLALTEDTEIELPEESPVSGVVARFDLIDVHVHDTIERFRWRRAHQLEIELLRVPRGSYVIAMERTYLADGVPVEVADIVMHERYELEYRLPID